MQYCKTIIGHEANYAALVREASVEQVNEWVSLDVLRRIARKEGIHALALNNANKSEDDLLELLQSHPNSFTILHLNAQKDKPEHLICVFLSKYNEAYVVGSTTYDNDAANSWYERWSGAVLLVSKDAIAGNGQSQPLIDTDITTYEAGEVVAGTKFNFKFELSNSGEKPLEIGKIESSCSCTLLDLDERVIEPGKTVILRGSVNSGSEKGKKSATIVVQSNDLEQPVTPLTIRWVVRTQLVKVSPPQIIYDGIVYGNTQQKILAINHSMGKEISVNSITTEDDWIDLKWENLDGKSLSLSATPRYSEGERHTKAVIEISDGKNIIRYILPVIVRVIKPIACKPRSIIVDRSKENGKIRRKVAVSSSADTKFDIKNVTMVDIHGNIISVTGTQSEGWVIDVEIDLTVLSVSESYVSGYLIVTTSLDDGYAFTVPIIIH